MGMGSISTQDQIINLSKFINSKNIIMHMDIIFLQCNCQDDELCRVFMVKNKE